MTNDKTKLLIASVSAPPRTLDVQKFAESRASELESLHSIVASRLNNDFHSQRNKRRRTTSYENRVKKRRFRTSSKVAPVDRTGDVASNIEQKRVSRRIRRRIELRKNLQHGFCTFGDGTKRLRTHVWHAKRFTMTKIWGFHLPLGLHGSGRGSRTLLKKFKDGALVHDASYSSVVQLDGPEDLLLSVLGDMLVPSPKAYPEDIFSKMLAGSIYGSAMLYHIGGHCSLAIAPVTYMWRPFLQQFGGDIEGHHSTRDHVPQADSCSYSRQLWIWLHAAAFEEGYGVLKSACLRQMEITGRSVDCVSLEGHFAKLEILGSRAFELLQKIMQPLECMSNGSSDSKVQLNGSILENEDLIPSSAIIALKAIDPRILANKGAVVVPEAKSICLMDPIQEDEVKVLKSCSNISNTKRELTSSLLLKLKKDSDLPDLDLWDVKNVIRPPVEENVLCLEKHKQRIAFFGLKETDTATASKDTSDKEEKWSRWCPIILLKKVERSLVRWSIILPLCWLKAFWIPLVSCGGRAIGLRERHWISCEVGLPYFPFDFPDCSAYSYFMESEAISSDRKASLCPSSMQPIRVPIPPPWQCIQFALNNVCRKAGDAWMHPEESSVKKMVYTKSLTELDPQSCDVAAVGGLGVQFDSFVARTSLVLTHFLNDINGDHLLLFPEILYGKKNISKFMKDERLLGQYPNGTTSLTNGMKKLCLLRVFLHVYKEGVFEKGAVVCAPFVTDISLWTSRSGEDEKLQILESSMRSYFVQQPTGKWELQVPDDPKAKETHRWPIGFVTTGAVYGSKRPVATALCEAVSLAHLREEQWSAVPANKRKKHIYVLVRNLRSTAYRLALATIVLEQQEHDVEYM